MKEDYQCRLGGRVTLQGAPGARWVIGHTSGPATVVAPSYEAAAIITKGLMFAATYGEADALAPGLLSQGMAPIDRFLADPDGQPSPGGVAARRAMFK